MYEVPKHIMNNDEEIVHNRVFNQDHVLVDIDSQDLWLKVKLEMLSDEEKSFESEFEIKIDYNMQGK